MLNAEVVLVQFALQKPLIDLPKRWINDARFECISQTVQDFAEFFFVIVAATSA